MLRRRVRYKIIILTVFTVILSSALYGVANANSYDGLDIAEKLGEYHLRVNEITNNHFNSLISFFEGKDDIPSFLNEETRELFIAPENLDECGENFSTACLAHKLNAEYEELVDSLQENLERADIDNLRNEGDVTGGIRDLGLSNEFAQEQLELSLELQRQTVAFYRQTMFAYPLHIQYEITIDELNEFLSNLRQINRRVSIYPSKFHNATTAQCQ